MADTLFFRGDLVQYTSTRKTRMCIVLGYVDGARRFNVKVLKCGSTHQFRKVEHVPSDMLKLFARSPEGFKPGTQEHIDWVNKILPSLYNTLSYTVDASCYV